ncbi:hypothetical protein [Aquimarina rhabdastrellae]
MLRKKLIVFGAAIAMLASCQSENDLVVNETAAQLTKTTQKSSARYEAQINIVDDYGNPVGSHDLSQFYAQNLDTGRYYYPDNPYREYVDIIEDLPEGTYLFGVMDGYFDGASSTIVEVNSAAENEDGFVEVNLVYWSE